MAFLKGFCSSTGDYFGRLFPPSQDDTMFIYVFAKEPFGDCGNLLFRTSPFALLWRGKSAHQRGIASVGLSPPSQRRYQSASAFAADFTALVAWAMCRSLW